MNKKKLLIILASAIACVCLSVVVVLVVVLGKKVENIDILKNDMPQLVYVQGSDLNLSEGKLTALVGDEKMEIALDDPEVTITGYDKNKLGEQLLTVTYEEQTTTFKVKVVPRVVADGYEGSYFVGEAFNPRGSLTITNDDGTDFSVDIDDATVTVTGFDTAQANGALTLTTTYEKENVSYSGTFDVIVYEADAVEFKSPSKKYYENHETKLDVTGGYLKLVNEASGTSRYCPITTDMVSGFDLSAATVENREENYVQTLTVEYAGYEKTYEIEIHFSDESLMKLRASQMKNLEWTGAEKPEDCDETMGENALEAMTVYFEMTESDKASVLVEDIQTIAKVAATYGLEKWNAAFESYSDAFYRRGGNTYWNCQDYAKTKVVYERLLAKEEAVYGVSQILSKIAAEFGSLVVYAGESEETHDDVAMTDVLQDVYSNDEMDGFAGQIGFMIQAYEGLKDVPENWTSEDLKTTYKDDLEATWVILRETEYSHIRYRNLFTFLSAWREKNDYFEILYDYYYDADVMDEGGKVDLTKINAFKDYGLPGRLADLYTLLYTAKTQVEYMANQLQFESTVFGYTYEQALKLKADILANGTDMEKDLYKRLGFDYLLGDGQGGYVLCSFDQLFDTFRRTNYGYLYHFNANLGVEEFEELWNEYVVLIDSIDSEEYYQSKEFGAAVESLLARYAELTPMQRFSFTVMLNPYYSPYATAWYDGEGAYNNFVYFVYKHYRNILPESTHDALKELMIGYERLAASTFVGFQDFTQSMQSVNDLLDSIELADKNAFLNAPVLGDIYRECNELANAKFADPTQPVAEELGAYKGDFEELLNAYYNTYFLLNINSNFQQNGRPQIILAIVAYYEKAEEISTRLLESGDESVLRAYYYDTLMLNTGEGTPQFGGTMDYLRFYFRDQYTNLLTGSLFTSDLLWDYYNEINTVNANGMDLKDYIIEASYVYYNFVYWQVVGSSDLEYKFFSDKDQMMKILNTFRELSIEQRHFLVSFEVYGTYRNSMAQFAKEQITNAEGEASSDAMNAVRELIILESYYTYYEKMPDAKDDEGNTYLSIVDKQLKVLLKEYYYLKQDATALEGFNSYFGETYKYYIAKCEAAGLDVTPYTPSVTDAA